MRPTGIYDSQQQLAFLEAQTSYHEAEVYKIQYPEIQYPKLIPVDNSAPEWARSITYYSTDRVGKAEWFDAKAGDMPLSDINRDRRETGVEMAAIGYGYDLEELGVAMMIPGMNLSADKAEAARLASEEFIDRIVRTGDARKGITGMFNNPYVTTVSAPTTGTGSSSHWEDKTADQIIYDVNSALNTINTNSNTVELADTVLLPVSKLLLLSQTRIPNTDQNALSYLAANNVWTFQTGQKLTILGVIGLDTAGAGSTARMMVYRKDPRVLKMHIPMTHRFLPVRQVSAMRFEVPGIMRVAGVEIRRPGACSYTDGI